MSYTDNIYREIKYINKSCRGQIQIKTKPSKVAHYQKLIKYECMSMGHFKMAKLFK